MKTDDDPILKNTTGIPEEGSSPENPQKEESLASAVKSASKAINETAGKYLAAAGNKIDLEDIQNRIRDRPLFYVTIAAGIGLVAGGLATKMTLLGVAGRRVAPETARNFGRQMLRQATGGGSVPVWRLGRVK